MSNTSWKPDFVFLQGRFVENVKAEYHPNPYPESILPGKSFGREIHDQARSGDACFAKEL
jgi:hypothetical protein